MDEPLNRDVVSFKPTVVFINFGMNDHNYEPFREDIFKTYVRSQTHLVKTLIKNSARVVLLTPQPIENRSGDPSTDPRNQSIRKFADGLKEVGRQGRRRPLSTSSIPTWPSCGASTRWMWAPASAAATKSIPARSVTP